MKTRPIITIIGSALTLLLLFAALPAGADHSIIESDSTCGYNGASIADFKYSGERQGEWILKWGTVPHAITGERKMQANGGGIFTVWTTINPNRLYWEGTLGGDTFFEMTALSPVAGQTLYFRVSVKCAGNSVIYNPKTGRVEEAVWEHTPTAEISKN